MDVLTAAALLAAVLLAAPARAASSLGGDWTTGLATRGWDARGSLDLDAKRTWEADAAYSYLHTANGTESRSHQLTLTLAHDLDDELNAHGSLTGWRDTLNGVQYAGPSFGVSFTAREAPSADGGPGDEDYRLSFDSDLYDYRADQTTTRTVTISRRRVTLTDQGTLSLAQWHPYAQVEKPLFSGWVVPSLSAGHYFYSKGPALIEQRAGQPRFSASAGSINGLVGGLLSNSGTAALTFYLPWSLKLGAALGGQQSATDDTWATTQSASADVVLADHAELAASVSRTIQGGQHQDLTTAGASWLF